MDGATLAAELFPGLHLAGEHRGQLRRGQGLQGVGRVQDDGQAVDGDHLFGVLAAQVAEAGQVLDLGILDRARGGGQIGAAVLECGEAGGGAMGCQLHLHRVALGIVAEDMHLVLLVAGRLVDGAQAFLFQHPLDQRRSELGADGVGALDAQDGGGLGGEYRPGEGIADETEQQQAEGSSPQVLVAGGRGARHGQTPCSREWREPRD
ncbi:hypothetical protein D3C84_601230 [compost metagenome]